LVTLLCFFLLVIRHLLSGDEDISTLSTLPPCYSGDSPRILIVVTSKVQDNVLRNIFRDGPMKHTWISCSGKKLDLQWRFSLQYTSSLYEGYLPYHLTLESETHQDLIENVNTRYSNKGTRLRVLEGILSNFDWHYLIKISDDTLIDPVRILNYLEDSESIYYGGLVGLHQASVPYTLESLTIYSRTALMNILAALKFVEREPNNDAVTVGKIATALKLQPSQIGRGFNGSINHGAVCREAVFITDVPSKQLTDGYHSLITRGSFC